MTWLALRASSVPWSLPRARTTELSTTLQRSEGPLTTLSRRSLPSIAMPARVPYLRSLYPSGSAQLGGGRVKSHYLAENAQSYCLRMVYPKSSPHRRPRNDSKLPNDWRRSSFRTATASVGMRTLDSAEIRVRLVRLNLPLCLDLWSFGYSSSREGATG